MTFFSLKIHRLWGKHMKANLINHSNGRMKEVKVGFSWTTFFFGFFVPLFRGDIKWAAIMFVATLIVGGVTGGVGSFFIGMLFCFMYNKFYTKDMLKKGFVPASEVDRDIFNSKGYLDN